MSKNTFERTAAQKTEPAPALTAELKAELLEALNSGALSAKVLIATCQTPDVARAHYNKITDAIIKLAKWSAHSQSLIGTQEYISADKVREIQLATVKATLEKVATNENLHLGDLQSYWLLKTDPQSIIEKVKI